MSGLPTGRIRECKLRLLLPPLVTLRISGKNRVGKVRNCVTPLTWYPLAPTSGSGHYRINSHSLHADLRHRSSCPPASIIAMCQQVTRPNFSKQAMATSSTAATSTNLSLRSVGSVDSIPGLSTIPSSTGSTPSEGSGAPGSSGSSFCGRGRSPRLGRSRPETSRKRMSSRLRRRPSSHSRSSFVCSSRNRDSTHP